MIYRHVSRSHVHKVMNTLGDESMTRKEVVTAFHDACDEVYNSDVAIQLCLEQEVGDSFEWDIASPAGVLRDRAKSSAGIGRFFSALETSRNAPVHVLIAHDEVTPGNISKPDNKRKFVAFYFSIREFGRHLLCNSAFWFCFGILRSNVVSNTVGGLSYVIRMIARLFLFGRPGIENFVSGVTIVLNERPRLFFGKISNIVADGGGEKPMFCISGSGGNKTCLRCNNVVRLGLLTDPDERIENSDGYFVEIDCIDWDEIVENTDQNIWDGIDLVALKVAACANPTQVKKVETAYGYNHNPHGLLADLELRRHLRPWTSTRKTGVMKF